MRTSFRALGLLAPAIALQHGATFRHAPHSERRHHLTYSTRGSLSEFRRFYREGDLLGEGSFAIVKKGTDLQTRESVAVKEIDKERSNELAIENEILVMEKLGKHENIVALRGVFESATAVYVVQDLAEGGELFDVVVKRGELSERMASKYFADAVRGVKHMHEKHVVHLDIKPENLLLHRRKRGMEERVVLADFGLALYAGRGGEASELDFCVGTPAYWAPEMVRREQFGLGVDIWALGCVLYILLCGTHPFDPTGEAPEAQILARIVRADYDKTNEAYQSLSRSARDLMRHLLDVDPHTRYTAQQILMHPWLTERERNSDTPINTERLQGFRVLTLIKRGIPQLLAKAESDLFTIIDKDGDGFLTKPELAAALELIGVPVTPQELDAFLRLADSNSDGKVSREEFDTVLLAQFQGLSGNVQQKSSLQDLEALFCSFDRDEDGYISSDDLDHVLSLLGTAQAKSASGRPELEKADLDGDGRISFAEFVRFVRLTEEEKKDQVGSGMASTVLRIRDKRDVLKSRR